MEATMPFPEKLTTTASQKKSWRMVMKKFFVCLFVVVVFALPVCSYAGDSLTAAVAANFMSAFDEISVLFEQETGIKVEATYTSTGKLYAQIVKGAPYDLFLAADEKRPNLLYKDALCEKPFVYAQGQVVLWSKDAALCDAADWKQMVTKNEIKTIAIANTESAPYGTSSMIALQKAGLWDKLQSKFVFPQTIAQVFQYASTGSTDVGFCAYSSAMSDKGKAGCYLLVKEAPAVIQAACILKRTEHPDETRKLAEFLSSKKAQEVKQRYGYR